jgi:hypothetical protein
VAGVSSSGSSSEERAAAVAAAVAHVYDIQALRVVVPHKHDCYAAMRCVQDLWTAMPGRIKDYIRNRKANGYQVGCACAVVVLLCTRACITLLLLG